MRITIAGGSGFLGRALSDRLRAAGHEVVVLSRREGDGGSRVTWTPDGTVGPWAAAVDGAGAVVNLAGESIAAGRWTETRKESILHSRVNATRSLVAAIAAVRRPPATLISSSAQGYYGERGDEELTEEAAPGNDFLARVCVAWETEAREAERHTRVVLLRTGVVLSAHEGALPQMVRPFRMFAGGPVGSGNQYLSWIHWRDWVGMTVWALQTPGVAGPVNVAAPAPVRNKEFAAAVGTVLHRPSWLPAPAFALRAGLGEMADSLLLTSIRMRPRRALELGYRFEFESVEAALRDLL